MSFPSLTETKDHDHSELEKSSFESHIAYQNAQSGELHRTLKNRHVQMISIGEFSLQQDYDTVVLIAWQAVLLAQVRHVSISVDQLLIRTRPLPGNCKLPRERRSRRSIPRLPHRVYCMCWRCVRSASAPSFTNAYTLRVQLCCPSVNWSPSCSSLVVMLEP